MSNPIDIEINKDDAKGNSNNIPLENNQNQIYYPTEAAYLTNPTQEEDKNEYENQNISQEKLIVESNIKKLSEKDGRWEYLYHLNKLKKIKNHYIKEIVEKDQEEKNNAICTFSPKTNRRTKYLQGYSQLSKNIYSNQEKTGNMSPLSFNYNSQYQKKSFHKNSLIPAAYSKLREVKPSKGIVDCNMFERQKILQETKNEKIQILKSMDVEKEFSECYFKPRIVIKFNLNSISI